MKSRSIYFIEWGGGKNCYKRKKFSPKIRYFPISVKSLSFKKKTNIHILKVKLDVYEYVVVGISRSPWTRTSHWFTSSPWPA